MAFPPGWVNTAGNGLPRPPGIRSMRFFVEGTATANFSDRAYNFSVPANGSVGDQSLQVPPSPKVSPGQEVGSGRGVSAVVSSPQGGQRDVAPASQSTPVTAQAAYAIRISNDGSGVLELSFDGVSIHGVLLSGETREWRRRFEPGVAVRGRSTDTPNFRIEAW